MTTSFSVITQAAASRQDGYVMGSMIVKTGQMNRTTVSDISLYVTPDSVGKPGFTPMEIGIGEYTGGHGSGL